MELDNVQDVTTDVTSDESLFDDVFTEAITEEETHEETTEENAEEVKEETTESNEVKPFSLHVKYNGEEKDLSEDEARTFAQKGMNYDHIFDPLHKLAKLNGLKVEEYLDKLGETQTEFEVSKELETLKEKYPDTPEEVLNELAQKRVSENQNLQFKRMEEEAKGNDDALRAEIQRQIDKFKSEYPDLEPDKLDPQVYSLIENKGYTLLEAYNKFNKTQEEINKPIIEAKEKVDKLNEENKKKSLGNTTNAGGDEPNDFFSGLDSI